MANEEQLAILKQGVEVWNKWRTENPGVYVDFSGADLTKAYLNWADLKGVNLKTANLTDAQLRGADLMEANLLGTFLSRALLSGADLRGANLSGAHLRESKLNGADLRSAILIEANLIEADLTQARLSKADLIMTNFHGADFTEANLFRSNLYGSNLSRVNLVGTDLLQAEMNYTIFGYSDLSEAIGLESVVHRGPSRISTDTFALSKGKIPEVFLRGCGLSDWEIESAKMYNPELNNEEINKILYNIYDLRASQALQISPLFISYSHTDSEFVVKLESYLNNKGIRFWRDMHDMKSGRIETQVDRAIRQNPTVLLILSEHSLKSDWVEHEVKEARKLEKELGRDVLCPIALDDSWKDSPWPKRVMEQVMEYNILDFSAWKDDSKFGNTFNKLIDGLELFYKG